MSKLLRIIILEDSENDAILLQRELRRGGYDLDTLVVDNVNDFEATLTQQEWDVVISDYAMNNFDARTALTIMQEKQLDIPFIIVSSTVSEDVAVDAMKAGADDFFSKDKLMHLVPAVQREVTNAIERRQRRIAEARFAMILHETVVDLFDGDVQLDVILQRILQSVTKLIPNDSAVLLKVEDGVARPLYSIGLSDRDRDKVTNVALVIDKTRNLHEASQSRQPIIVSDINDYDQWRIDIMPEDIKIISNLSAPIYIKDHLFGFLTVDSKLPNHFTKEHADRLAILTDQAAIAIHNAQLYEQIKENEQFAKNTVNALSAHIAILDESGTILSVNQAWLDFARANTPSSITYSFEGQNYLAICDATQGPEKDVAAKVATGIRSIISGQESIFTIQYPCHTSDKLYWFTLRVTRFVGDGQLRVVVAHENITEQKLLELSLERYAKRLGILREIDQAILREDNPKDIAESVLARVIALMDYYSASITLYDLEAQQVEVLAASSPIMIEFGVDTQHTIQNTDTLSLLKQNKIYVVNDLQNLASKSQREQVYMEAGIRSYARIPIVYNDKLLGSINFHDEKLNAFLQDDFVVAREVAAQLAIALENTRLLGVEMRRATEITAIHQASLQLTNTLDLETVLNTILDYAIQLIEAHNAHIYLYDGERLTFGAAMWDGQNQSKPLFDPQIDGFIMQVAESGQRTIVNDMSSQPAYFNPDQKGSIINLPLSIVEQVKGVMSLAFLNFHDFDEHEIRVIELLADQAAIAIHNAQLYGQIQQHADDLEQIIKQRTRQFQRAKEHVEAILNTSNDFLLLTNKAGKIYQTNPGLDQQFGYLPDALIGKTYEVLIEPEYLEEVQSIFDKVISEKSPDRIQTIARRHDGESFPVDVLMSPISDEMEDDVVFSLRDITLQKRVEAELREALEREKELNELKSQFTSIVSHEFRTPLAVILSSSDLLLKYSDRLTPEKRQEKLKQINHQVLRLTKLMDDILLITQNQVVGFDFNPAQTDLLQLCETIIEEVQVRNPANIPIILTYEGNCRDVMMDEFLFTHILQNLGSNAVKYSKDGGQVFVNLQCDSKEVILTVEDQGIGIPEDHQTKLFESFQRASNVGQIQGTGIGMTIVKHAIDTHGGAIEFTSIENEGTTFVVTLPNR